MKPLAICTTIVALVVLVAAAPAPAEPDRERYCGSGKNGLGVFATTDSCRFARRVANKALTLDWIYFGPGSGRVQAVRVSGKRMRCRVVQRRDSPPLRCTGRPGQVTIRS